MTFDTTGAELQPVDCDCKRTLVKDRGSQEAQGNKIRYSEMVNHSKVSAGNHVTYGESKLWQ